MNEVLLTCISLLAFTAGTMLETSLAAPLSLPQ
jgi:hypothetical protein